MKPRQVVPGRVYMVTRRCTRRHHLLAPDEFVVQTYEYTLAEAAQRFDISLFGWTTMSNHQHVLLRDNEGQLPRFTGHMHKMFSKVINPYRGWTENLWSTEQPNHVWLVDPEDMFDKLLYTLLNPVAADLVEEVAHWPGASSLAQNLYGRERIIERPYGYFRKNGPMPPTVTLRAERLPGYEHLSQEEWKEKVFDGVRKGEKQERTRRTREKRRVVGRKAVLRTNPTSRPKTEEPKNRLKPTVAAQNPERRVAALDILRGFLEAYTEALRRFIHGKRNVEFPLGTYRMRLLGARCAIAPILESGKRAFS
ncbi:hypothetical protein AKJ09_06139 [Labilithrix luteola]|uniref:Transposase IS200-like domain-containing protein n=1 Tax=Labilithrix luteola TaxID=1391654 RepID=A0A0K1Q113_9BACT|nr:transposase [Labilithrix luteola]AKU99475.1 hypothetical protein AKJ09_06139 [Labilithrix luteola]